MYQGHHERAKQLLFRNLAIADQHVKPDRMARALNRALHGLGGNLGSQSTHPPAVVDSSASEADMTLRAAMNAVSREDTNRHELTDYTLFDHERQQHGQAVTGGTSQLSNPQASDQVLWVERYQDNGDEGTVPSTHQRNGVGTACRTNFECLGARDRQPRPSMSVVGEVPHDHEHARAVAITKLCALFCWIRSVMPVSIHQALIIIITLTVNFFTSDHWQFIDVTFKWCNC
jgi:hypothetical protein